MDDLEYFKKIIEAQKQNEFGFPIEMKPDMKTQNKEFGYYWTNPAIENFDWVRYDRWELQGYSKLLEKWVRVPIEEKEHIEDLSRHMIKSDIESELKKVAYFLGYKKGTPVISIDGLLNHILPDHYTSEWFEYLPKHDILYAGSFKIYEKGQWAEIVDAMQEPKYQGREHMAERILDKIKEDAKNPKIEQRLFTMKSIGKYITLFQDFNRIEVSFSVSNSNEEEQNIIIHLCFLFWAIEVAFEWRPFKR